MLSTYYSSADLLDAARQDKSARKGANKLAASGMTEEELIKQQEALFANSRARYEAAAAPEPSAS